MGCRPSVVAAPAHLLPDPDGPSSFILIRHEPGSHHYLAYQRSVALESETEILQQRVKYHKERGAEAPRWLYIRYKGSFWEDDAHIEVENFHRGHDPVHPDKGRVLYKCDFNETPEFHREYHDDSTSDGEWSEDEYAQFKRARLVKERGHEKKHAIKWKMWTRCTFSCTDKPTWILKVKAKGTATRKVKKKRGHAMVHEFEDKERVKKLTYKLYRQDRDVADDNDMDARKEFRWKCFGRLNRHNLEFTWDNPFYRCTTIGGIERSAVSCPPAFAVDTKEGFDPVLSLLVAHVAACEFTPDNIKHDFHPHWDAQGNTYSSDSSNAEDENQTTYADDLKFAEEQKELGNQFYAQSKWHEAAQCYHHAIEKDPENAVHYCNLSAVQLMMDAFEASISSAKTAVALDPSYMKAYLRLGCAYRATGHTQEAKAALDHAKHLDPANEVLDKVIDAVLGEHQRQPDESAQQGLEATADHTVDWLLE